MENKQIDEIGDFLKLVDAKFEGQTLQNGPDDPRRLTVGLAQRFRLVT